jgi:hypothetical protein
VLVASDVFQFTWRYQLPALITLPPAGVAGLTIAGTYVLARARRAGNAEAAEKEKPSSPSA